MKPAQRFEAMLATGWLLASGEAYRANDIFGAWFCGFFSSRFAPPSSPISIAANRESDMSHQTEIDEAVSDSGYLTEAWRKAASTTEAEAREQRIGEAGQRAFLGTIDTAQLIFLARSKVQELNQRNYISSRAFDEELIAECLTLTKGDELKARLLAAAVLQS